MSNTKTIFKIYFIYFAYMYLYHICLWHPKKPEEGIDGGKSLYECWEPSLSPLQE